MLINVRMEDCRKVKDVQKGKEKKKKMKTEMKKCKERLPFT